MSGTQTDGLAIDYDSSGDNTSELPLAVDGIAATTAISLTIQQQNAAVTIQAADGATVTQGATADSVIISGTDAAVNATLASYEPPPSPDTATFTATDGTVTAEYGDLEDTYYLNAAELIAPAAATLLALSPVAFPALTVPILPQVSGSEATVTLTAASGTFFIGDLSALGPVTVTGAGASAITITSQSMTTLDGALASLLYVGSGSSDTVTATLDAGAMTYATLTIPLTLTQPATGGSFTWSSGAGSWQNAANWSGADGTRPPNAGDQVTLASDDSVTTIAGPGAAAGLSVDGLYLLSGVIDVAGALDVSGVLGLIGSSATDQAQFDTQSADIEGGTAIQAEVDVTSANWINAGTLQIGSSAGGVAGAGIVEIRDGGTLTSGNVDIGAGGLLSIVSASNTTITGTLTVGDVTGPVDGANGVLVAAGNLTADTLLLNDGASVLTKGVDAVNELIVSPGALFGGISTVETASGGPTTIVNDGTIDGPVAILPLDLNGDVTGDGQLDVDGAGGLTLQQSVAGTQTVVFEPGRGALVLTPNGATGGILTLSDPADFAATIDGFAFGDSIGVVSPNVQLTTVTLLVGNRLALGDSTGAIDYTLQLDPTADYSGQTFNITAVANQDDNDNTIPSTEFVVEVQPTGLAIPVINTAGGGRVQQGLTGVVPLVSLQVPYGAADPAVASNAAQDNVYTETFTVTNGSLTELASLANGQDLNSVPGPGDGALTSTDAAGNPVTLLSVQGTGTQQLTISSTGYLALLNLQAALVLYTASGSAGTSNVTVTASATINGQTITAAPVSVPFDVATTPVTYTWITGGSQDGTAAANWSGSDGEAGPPGAGDPTIFGAGAYAVTGDISTGPLYVRGDTFLTGAIYVAGNLVADQDGAAAFGGALYVTQDVLVGADGDGEFNLSGILNIIEGDVDIGVTGTGYFQTDAAVNIDGALNVGLGAIGSVDIGANTGSGADFGSGAFSAAAASIGVGAGVAGSVQVQNTELDITNGLTVGAAGIGALQLLAASTATGVYTADSAAIVTGSLTAAAQAGSTGTITLSGNSTLTVTGAAIIGQDGTASLILDQGSSFNEGDEVTQPSSLAIGADAGSNGTVDVFGGNLVADAVSVGGTDSAAGGTGTLFIDSFVDNTNSFEPATTASIDRLIVWADGTVTLAGTSGTYLGELNVAGGLVALEGGALIVSAGIQLSGDPNPLPGVTVGAGGTIEGTGTIDVAPPVDSATDTYGAPIPIQNAGLIQAAGGVLTLGSTDNTGQIVATPGAQIVFPATEAYDSALLTVNNSGTIAANGGSLTVNDISEDNGNGQTVVAPSLQNTGTITANDGAVTIDTSVTGTGTLLLQNGTLHLGEAFGTATDANSGDVYLTGDDYGSIAPGQTITFAGTSDTLDIQGLFSDPQADYRDISSTETLGTVAGFAPGDAIYFDDASYNVTDTYAEGVLTVDFQARNGYGEIALDVGDGYTTDDFVVQNTIFNGSNAVELTTTAVACYARGTRILTVCGEIAVEELQVGDLVVTCLGLGSPLKPVRWLGHRRINLRRHPDPENTHPIRFRAGSLGMNRPYRDLLVSPGHRMRIDDVLVRALELVNGATIVQENPNEIEYWHIELDRHDLVMAEGVHAETYQDIGNRSAFENCRIVALHPALDGDVLEPCLPYAGASSAVRARLIGRAEEMGWTRSRESAPWLEVNGQRITPVRRGEHYRFTVPEGSGSATLRSPSGRPWDVDASSDDRRQLGLKLHRLALGNATGVRKIALNSPHLGKGFDHVEQDETGWTWRWTDGDALLPLAKLAPRRTVTLVEIAFDQALQMWVAPPPDCDRARVSGAGLNQIRRST